MKTDYLDAHERHLEDAEMLFDGQRLANADHLYGIAAECGVKQLMVLFGMQVDSKGTPTDRKNWFHADQAWTRYESYRTGYAANTLFSLPSDDPFHDWKVEQRYYNRTDFDIGIVTAHRSGAIAVKNLMKNVKISGLEPEIADLEGSI